MVCMMYTCGHERNDYMGTRQGPFPWAEQCAASRAGTVSPVVFLWYLHAHPRAEQWSEVRLSSGSGAAVPGECFLISILSVTQKWMSVVFSLILRSNWNVNNEAVCLSFTHLSRMWLTLLNRIPVGENKRCLFSCCTLCNGYRQGTF